MEYTGNATEREITREKDKAQKAIESGRYTAEEIVTIQEQCINHVTAIQDKAAKDRLAGMVKEVNAEEAKQSKIKALYEREYTEWRSLAEKRSGPRAEAPPIPHPSPSAQAGRSRPHACGTSRARLRDPP